jgi:phosphoribosylamine--glycine ligase
MRKQNVKVGVIGKDGRTSAIERCLRESPRLLKGKESPSNLSEWKNQSPQKAYEEVLRNAKRERPDFVIVGPEEPLAAGIVDALEEIGIPCIGPRKSLARLESSKEFTRNLLSKYHIPGNPEYRVFNKLDGVEAYLSELGDYVIKPDGLTGGKGVKISDAQLFSLQEAVRYCEEMLREHPVVVIEAKLEGEEFSLQSFCDGLHVKDMVVVQDHKRAGEGDTGPNTGGMGSYSCEDHSLPFLTRHELEQAAEINKAVAKALLEETNQKYKGILYGGFMATKSGVRLLEYNARFGDPETLNVLSVLKTDFLDICEAIIEERLHELPIVFENRATVCKYIVPKDYPDNPVKGERIDLSKVPKDSERLRTYRAAVTERAGNLYLTGSRAIAFVGIGKDLQEAESVAEQAASAVGGPVYYRKDIGTHELIHHRIEHMRSLRAKTDSKGVASKQY